MAKIYNTLAEWEQFTNELKANGIPIPPEVAAQEVPEVVYLRRDGAQGDRRRRRGDGDIHFPRTETAPHQVRDSV